MAATVPSRPTDGSSKSAFPRLHGSPVNSKSETKTVSVQDGDAVINVSLGYKLNAIGTINNVAGTFYTDFKLFAWWREPPQREPGAPPFDPELIVVNEHELERRSLRRKIDKETGEVKMTAHYAGTVFEHIELSNFPFDFQDLRIVVRPRVLPLSKCVLKVRDNATAVAYTQNHDWKLIGQRYELYASAPSTSTTGKVYNELHLVIMVRRNIVWFFWNVWFAIFVLITSSLSVFAMPPTDLGSRMETCVALILAIVATKWVVSEQLPKTSYQTVADHYIWSGFIVLYIVAIGCVVIATVPAEWQEVSNYVVLVLAIVLFSLVHLVLYCRLHSHYAAMAEWKKKAGPFFSNSSDRPPRLLSVNWQATPAYAASRSFKAMMHRKHGDGGLSRAAQDEADGLGERWWHLLDPLNGGKKGRSSSSSGTATSQRALHRRQTRKYSRNMLTDGNPNTRLARKMSKIDEKTPKEKDADATETKGK